MNEVGKNEALIAEYKEMRDEIRAAWTQYYSILVGIGLTGIATSFYFAVSRCDEWLFLFIPILTISWLSLITTIRANIKHISNYIEKLEEAINSPKVMFYESKYAKKLWESTLFYILNFFIIIPLIFIQGWSIKRGREYMIGYLESEQKYIHASSVFISDGVAFIMLILTLLALIWVFLLPRKVSKRVYDEEKG